MHGAWLMDYPSLKLTKLYQTEDNYNNCQNFDLNQLKNRLLGKISNSKLIYMKLSNKNALGVYKQEISLEAERGMDEVRHIKGLNQNYFLVGCLYKVFLTNGGQKLKTLYNSNQVKIYN